MVDDAERRRVQALFHELALNWYAGKEAADMERPLAKLERRAKYYKENPCVSSPLLLKSMGIYPRAVGSDASGRS